MPPEWRTGLPPAVERLRASVVVGARGEVLDAGGAQHGCVAPGIGRHIGDVGVVVLAARRAIERVAGVGRADQRLQAGSAGHQVHVLRRDRNTARSHRLQELLLRRRRARAQVLLHQPDAIEGETHVRVVAHLFQQAIQVAVLQFLDLRLVVGETDIEVGVRHEVDRKLAFGSDRFGAHVAPAVEQQGEARGVRGGLTGAQQRQRIPTDLRIAVFVRHVVHGRDAQLVVALPQRARRDRDALSGFGADRRIGSSLGMVAQAAVDVRRGLRAVEFEFQTGHARIAGHDGEIQHLRSAGSLLHPEPDRAGVRLRARPAVAGARLRGRPASGGIRRAGVNHHRLTALAPAELGRGVVERPDALDRGFLAPQRQARGGRRQQRKIDKKRGSTADLMDHSTPAWRRQ